MMRRDFIALTGGAAVAWPFGARAQQSAMPVIGFLSGASPAQWATYVAAFRKGLSETGYVEGKNVGIEFSWAEGRYDRVPALAADLVHRKVSIIVASGGGGGAEAAKALSSTIPIVFVHGGNAIATGLVASLGHPGGNVTGVSFFTLELMAKRLELLHEMLPKATVTAVIVNPYYRYDMRKVQEAAQTFGLHLHLLNAGTETELDAAFASFARLRPLPGALLVYSDVFFNARREQIVALAARHAVPAIYDGRDFVAAGGLMSYGANIAEVYRQAGVYTGKILNGAKPADLPVMQSTKIELVINAKTAKVLGLTIPQSLLLRADEVIRW